MQKEIRDCKNIIIGFSLLLLFESVNGYPQEPVSQMEIIHFEDCGSKFEITSITSTSCNTEPCLMKLNTNVNITVEFSLDGNTNTDYSSLTHTVSWTFKYAKKTATVTPPSCEKKCTSQKPNGLAFLATVEVASLPTGHGTLQWRVNNKNNKEIICFNLPIKTTIA